jgi:hypothetical protein
MARCAGRLRTPAERGGSPAGGLTDQGIEPRQGPLVLGGRPGRQARDGLVGGDREGLQLDQGIVDAPDP